MKIITAVLLSAVLAVSANAQTPLNLSTIVNANIQRFDDGPNIRVVVTLNLVTPLQPFHAAFYLDEAHINVLKNGTNPQKAAVRKIYIRRAVLRYLSTPSPPPPPVDESTVSKAQIQDAGDTP